MVHPSVSTISPEHLEAFCLMHGYSVEPGWSWIDMPESHKEKIRNSRKKNVPSGRWFRNHFTNLIEFEGTDWDSDYQSIYLVSKDNEVLLHSCDEHKDLKFYIDQSERKRFVFGNDTIKLEPTQPTDIIKESEKWWKTLLCLFKKQKN